MTISYHSGIDYFIGDPDKPMETDLACKACGTILKGEKVNGPRSWAGAMAGISSEHLSYSCPHSQNEFHEHLVELYKEWNRLVSKRLKDIVLGELMEGQQNFQTGHFAVNAKFLESEKKSKQKK